MGHQPAEGTLGGLVSQAEPERLVGHALADARRCSSDPPCGATGFLDRTFVVPINDPNLALLPDLP